MNLDRVNVGATILIPSNYVETSSSRTVQLSAVHRSDPRMSSSW
jgi:hypothetical protein